MDDRDIRDLAPLHCNCLPDSLVSELGLAYARSFYRYVTRSPRELVIGERSPEGRIVAGAVLSFEPQSLNRRLLVRTTLAFHLALRWRKALELAGSLVARGEEHGEIHDMPELLLIYADSSVRSQGIGSRLVGRVEFGLRARGVPEYQVKTVADTGNRALSFYERLGFERSRIIAMHGRRFQVFTKAGL